MRALAVLVMVALTSCAQVGQDPLQVRSSADVTEEVLPAVRGDLREHPKGCETVRVEGRPETTCEY